MYEIRLCVTGRVMEIRPEFYAEQGAQELICAHVIQGMQECLYIACMQKARIRYRATSNRRMLCGR